MGVSIQAFNAVKAAIAPGLVLYLWVFAGASIFVGLISLPLLPETRNRRPSAVQRDLGYVDDGGVAKVSAGTNGHIATHIWDARVITTPSFTFDISQKLSFYTH